MAIRGGFEIATAYVDLILDKDNAKQGVKELPRDLAPAADKAGRDTGNVITRGIRLSIVRNSPLIAAAIAGGLAAGAPALLAGATLMMGGIAAIAVAQSDKVRSAWIGAWDNIKRGAIEDARVLEPTFVRMAGTVSDAFEEMRPAMRDAFVDLGPQLETLTGAVGRFAVSFTNGLVVAVKNGGPVIDGMAKAIVSIGDGFEDAMTRMAAHSGAAGDVWAQLGDIVGTLLSLLGEFLGIGVEIAHVMLPALGGSLKVVLGAAEALGPALPAIVTGFTALRIAQTASRWIDMAATSLGAFATRGGAAASTAGRASTVLAGLGRSVPLIAAGIGAYTVTTAQNEDRVKSWTQTLVAGGDAADNLRKRVEEAKDRGLGEWLKDTFTFADLWDDEAADNIVDDFEAASDAAKEYLDGLTPLAAAQQKVVWAQEGLSVAVDKYGVGSREAAAAQAVLDRATAAVTRQLELEERQLHGVTQAMIDMANQAAARANSDLAYRQSILDTGDAMKALSDAQREGKSSASELERMSLDVEASLIRQAEAAGTLAADALPATVGEQERAAFAARRSLEELEALRAKYGELPANLETYRQSLIEVAGGMDAAKLNTDALVAGLESIGATVTTIPDSHQIRIDAPTQEVVDRLRDLGFTVTDIPGEAAVLVSADTEEAKTNVGNISGLMADLHGTVARPVVAPIDLATGPLNQIIENLTNADGVVVDPTIELPTGIDALRAIDNLTLRMLGLDAQHATPSAELESTVPTQTDADIQDLLGLGGVVAKPQADMQSDVAPSTATDLGLLAGLGGVVATPGADLQDQPLRSDVTTDLGILANLDAQTPEPIAFLGQGPFSSSLGAIMGRIRELAGQRPTPNAFLNTGGFSASAGSMLGTIGVLARQRPTPLATLIASTGVAEGQLNYAARNRTAYVTLVSNASSAAAAASAAFANIGRATGGPVFAATGKKIVGPGGPFDDLVRAVGPGGTDYRLSAGEWIVNALASAREGDAAMRALNEGRATITMRDESRRGNGDVWRSAARGAPVDGPGTTTAGVTVTPTANGATVSVGQLHVHIQGVFDLTKPMEMRRLGIALRDILLSLEREGR